MTSTVTPDTTQRQMGSALLGVIPETGGTEFLLELIKLAQSHGFSSGIWPNGPKGSRGSRDKGI